MNIPSQAKPEDYRDFNGRNIDQMPLLLTGKNPKEEVIDVARVPLSAAGFMKLRLKALDLYGDALGNPNKYSNQYRKEVSDFFKWAWSNYADSGDAVLYHPDGGIKTDLDSATLRKINPKSRTTSDGAVLFESGLFAATKMPEFTREEVRKYTGAPQTGNQTLDNRFWRVLARDPNEVPADFAEDPKLLGNYVIAENKLAEIAYGYDKNLGVYVSDKPSQEQMRLWCVYWLGGGSGAGGGDRLGDDGGRLVGVAPEAPRLAAPPTERLEQIVATLEKHGPEVKKLLAA